MDWQKIETAPKDQRSILAAHERSGIMRVCWRVGVGHGRSAWDNGFGLWQPTHWQPLPPAPEGGAHAPPDPKAVADPRVLRTP